MSQEVKCNRCKAMRPIDDVDELVYGTGEYYCLDWTLCDENYVKHFTNSIADANEYEWMMLL